MTHLVQRLRGAITYKLEIWFPDTTALLREAANELVRLKAEAAELRAAIDEARKGKP